MSWKDCNIEEDFGILEIENVAREVKNIRGIYDDSRSIGNGRVASF